MRNRIWFSALILLAGAPALAAESSQDAARRCAQVQDSLQRLVCYDRIFAAPAASPAPAAAPAPTPAPGPPAAARPAPAPAPAPAAAVATPAPAAPVVQTFGAEQVKRSVEERKRDDGPETQTAKVAATREIRPNTWRITLENEQVWQQTESDTHFFINVGDAVVIKRGVLGSYQLEAEAGGRRVRVTRVK